MPSRKKFYEMLYNTSDESKLSWYREDAPEFLKKLAKSFKGTESVLDIGCGTGTNAVYLAKLGFKVTALDFVEKALKFAEKNSKKANVNIDFVHADIFNWKVSQTFDIVLDSGCLHNFRGLQRKEYKNIVLKLMNSKSYFILVHFGRKLPFSFPIGPAKRSKNEIISLFAPELHLLDFSLDKNGELYYYCFSK
ncbi:class I SAM-dependent methyltransferase [Clostridium sp. MT-14]|uniref:class I SAM-dependent methyltransferase n=1 Tax=unclassified Clostridium TaxID=2614128 RepID=UPI001238502D|nr:class I SAM-dependent methyltransferase [Clostridium sp. HV4-5-A1G]KAA8680572.1 class I SAM-dependent methyltransferase [Clostridium sp. HV4-5-A1G]